MEIGDYIRINGIIGKVEQIGTSLFWIEDGSSYSLSDESIKHSKNIIDLIENGDVLKVKTDENEIVYIGIDENTIDISYKELLDEIKQSYKLLEVLTKEQYEANCYRLEE